MSAALAIDYSSCALAPLRRANSDHRGSLQSATKQDGSIAFIAFKLPPKLLGGRTYGAEDANDNQTRYTGLLPEPFTGIIDPPDQLLGYAHPLQSIEDKSTGLSYMQARYYDPEIRRFLSVDPVDFVGSGYDPGMFNRYAYVGNDPGAEDVIKIQLGDKNSVTGPIEAAAVAAGVRIGVNSGTKKPQVKPGKNGDVAVIDLASSNTMTVINDDGSIESVTVPVTEVLEHEAGHIADALGMSPVDEPDVVTHSQFKERTTRKGVSESSAINRTNIYRRKSGQTRQRYCHSCSPNQARRHNKNK